MANSGIKNDKRPVDVKLLKLVLPLHKIASGKSTEVPAQNRRKTFESILNLPLFVDVPTKQASKRLPTTVWPQFVWSHDRRFTTTTSQNLARRAHYSGCLMFAVPHS